MTTSNAARLVEHVEGTVAASNERGLKLVGEEAYRNFSKYGEPIAPPSRGQRVSLGLDGSGFVRELQVLDSAAAAPSSSSRDREIRRMSVLKSAAQFLGAMAQVHEDVRSDHVLVLAEKWLQWIEQEEGTS